MARARKGWPLLSEGPDKAHQKATKSLPWRFLGPLERRADSADPERDPCRDPEPSGCRALLSSPRQLARPDVIHGLRKIASTSLVLPAAAEPLPRTTWTPSSTPGPGTAICAQTSSRLHCGSKRPSRSFRSGSISASRPGHCHLGSTRAHTQGGKTGGWRRQVPLTCRQGRAAIVSLGPDDIFP